METRIDLEWAKQKIHSFEKYMREVQAVKASEAEYRMFKAKCDEDQKRN